jgi:hypothetical protein
MCTRQLVLRRCSVNVNKSTASKLLYLNHFYEKCDEIKNQMQKHFPNEKSLCDEIKTLA